MKAERRFKVVMTDAAAELAVLSKANDKRKFGVPLGMALPDELQFAFERGIDNDWFRFVDLAPIAAMPGAIMRLFRLTDAGLERLAELAKESPTT